MAAPGQPEPGSLQIDSKQYFLAKDRQGRWLHETVSTGRELKEEWDFRNGSLGMGETVRQTDTGYFFTENIDATKRGLRLSPTILTSMTIGGPPASPYPPVFWEAQNATDGIRFLYMAYNVSATIFRVQKLRQATGTTAVWASGFAVDYTTSARAYPMRPALFNGVWVLPVYVVGGTDLDAWQVRTSVNDDRAAYVPAVTTTEVLDATETGVDVSDASVILNGDIIAVDNNDDVYRERMYVSSRVGNTLTVIRGYLGTDATTHVTGARVQNATSGTQFATDTVSVSDTAVSVNLAFLLDQTSGTPTIARVVNGSQVQKFATTAADSTLATNANYTNVGDVGDRSSKAQGAASHAGITLIGKQDNLYAFDKDGNSYAVIPSLNRFIDSVGLASGTSSVGTGTLSYGADTFYPHPSGLWLVRNVTEAKNIAVDKIPYYANVPNITAPIRLRYFEGWALGDWIYWIYTAQEQGGSTSYLLAMQFVRHPGHQLGVTWHTLLKRSAQMRGMFIDSTYKLTWAEEGATTLKGIQLAKDGSPDSSARGESTGTAEWYGPEVDFGEPEITKQLRYAFVEVESGVAQCEWQLKQHLDSGPVASVGDVITTAAATNINWTVGTTDTCRRFRPRFTATTTAHTTSNDPKILRLVVYARSADVVRYVLTPDDRRSHRDLFEMAKILRKLKNAGPITLREPDTNETHTCYIRAVNNISYDGPDGPAQGLEIIAERFTAAA